jgi:hypothetical protein
MRLALISGYVIANVCYFLFVQKRDIHTFAAIQIIGIGLIAG